MFRLRQLVSAAEAQDGEYVDQTLGSPFYAFKGLKVPYPGVRPAPLSLLEQTEQSPIITTAAGKT